MSSSKKDSMQSKSPAASKTSVTEDEPGLYVEDDFEEGRKFLTLDSVKDIAAFKDFECSARSSTVNLKLIHGDTTNALGDPDLGAALAYKFLCHGHKVKEGDYIKFKGVTYLVKDLLLKISKYQVSIGRTATVIGDGGLSRDSDKKMACVTRIGRAFAKTVSGLIHKGVLKVPPELLILGKGTGLPNHFCFLDACYGMSDEELLIHKDAYKVFCDRFTESVAKSYKSGRMPSTTLVARDHGREFESYVEWRGVELG